MSEKRDQIVAAALKLFCQKGFQNTSTAAISKEAGVATGTLFLYFKSKEELINALYSETKNAMAAYVQEDLPAAAAALETQLLHCWRRAAEWALEHPFHYRFSAMFSNSPFITKLTRDEAASSFLFMQDIIEKGIKQGNLAGMDKNLFISLFSGQLHATITFVENQQSSSNHKEVLEQTFHFFMKGVAAA
ncbi:TetR/AcrR family transcriptional regulator [Pontibacter akesuensis]|uniref:Transcriptional regulator, TetR family n=1 Tax=Pontibacter akesuensis TaxID=388950 RepID=A0A1I7GL31_9BACT|nr:TetR/AcrR family transcriptional regulator [Pontibacter akesuensis]GHA56197.1 TetR family transcriptional regulator [Pontibacter akesuensis]SFU49177.1 transcriptional regulator, TetR family [Pontibacter akesuensis]